MLSQSKKNNSHRETTIRQYLIQSEDRSHKSSNIQLPKLAKKKKNQQADTKLQRKFQSLKKNNLSFNIINQNTFSILSYEDTEPQKFKQIEQSSVFAFNHYQIFDLTYSLISANISKKWLFILYMLQVSIRYFSLLCLISITIMTNSQKWQWVLCLVATNTLYFICIVKISLKPPETQSETILKSAFDSLQQNQVVEYFQVISYSKLIKSVLRGMVPPQFSFCYIRAKSQRKIQIYSMINYMYCSIEAIIYYPFFIIYTQIIYDQNLLKVTWNYYLISISMIIFSQLVFISLTLYLIYFGCKRKGLIKSNYGKNQ